MRKLKILQVLPELNSGGVERGTLEIARYLSSNCHESVVISNGGRMVSQLEKEGSRHIELPVHRKNPLGLMAIPRLRKILLDESPDIVHARSRIPAWMVYLSVMRMNSKDRPRFVTTVHGFHSVNPYSAIMTNGDAVICVSNSIKNYVLENYPKTNPERLQLIPRGICSNEFNDSYKPDRQWLRNWYSMHPSTSGKKLLLLAGRISQLKGHDDFLLLLSRLPPSFHGVVVGSIHPKKLKFFSRLKEKIKELNIHDRITFTGPSCEMQAVYSICHATLSLSKKPESFGRTVLESLASGCPAIGYSHGGVGEILSTCFPFGVVNFQDREALVHKVLTLEKSRDKIMKISDFSLKRMQSETLSLYAKLISK